MFVTKSLTIVAALALSQASVMAGTSVNATYNSGLGSMAYRVYYPDNYQASGPNKTPVVLYLHSAAERGNSVNDIFSNSYGGSVWTNDWINHLVNETQSGAHQAVLIMPQSGLGQVWNSMTAGDNWGVSTYTNATAQPIGSRLQLAMNILDNVVASSNVNADKVYVTGASMGGYGAWDAAARFPEKFAAAAPVAGGGNLDLARTALSTTPIWSFHGAQDNLVPHQGTASLYFAHKQGGGDSIISYIAGVGHGGFDKFYQPGNYTTDKPQAAGGTGQNLYEWMFSQTRGSTTGGTPIEPGQAKVIIAFGVGASSSNNRAAYTASGGQFLAYNFVETTNIADLHDVNNASTNVSITRSGDIAPGGGADSYGPGVGGVLPLPFKHGLRTATQSGQMILTIAGLDPEQEYRVDVLGTAIGGATQVSTSRYQLTGEISGTQTINIINNDSFVTFDAFSPNASGQFILTVSGVNDFGYISNLVITPLPIPEPTSLAVVMVAGFGLLRRRRTHRA